MVSHTSVTILDESVPSRDFDGTVYIAMRPLVEALGLAWKPQYLAIKRRYGGQARLMPFRHGRGPQFRRMLGLPLSAVNEWAYSVNTIKIKRDGVLEKILEFREVLDVEAEAAAEEVVIAVRVMRLGEAYRNFPLQPQEQKLINDMRKPGQPLSYLSAILGYPYILPQVKVRMDLLRLITDS